MNNWQKLVSTGILELYVLGETSSSENEMIGDLAIAHPEIRQEIEEIELAMERYAMAHAVAPDPIVKPLMMATIDYMDRAQNGEAFITPPLLSETSKPADFAQWLNREDMVLPEDTDDVYAKIICANEQMMTAIAWIKQMAPQEVHDHEHEKFLILEGTCNIYVEDTMVSLGAGDYFAIPLHKKHHVVVTSAQPCKAILQRVAA